MMRTLRRRRGMTAAAAIVVAALLTACTAAPATSPTAGPTATPATGPTATPATGPTATPATGPTAVAPTQPPAGVTTITMAASSFGDPGRGPQLIELLDEFNESQSEVRIFAAAVPFPTFGQTILTQMGSGLGPDLVRFDMPEFAAASDAGLIEPLDGLIDVSQYNLHQQPDQFMVHDGVRHGIIWEASNYGLFYNVDLLPNPPTTYEEFFATAQSLTGGDTFGLAFRHTEPEIAGMWQDIFSYVYGFGGAWSDGTNLTINRPENLEGLQKYKDLYDANVIPRGADAATFRRMFAEGKVGMEINNGGYVAATQAANPDLNFSVVPIPFPVRSQGTILAPIVINANSPAKEAAATFIKWVLQPENQVKLQEILGASSVATVTQRSAESLEQTPFLTVLDELTDTSLPHNVLGFEAKTPEIRDIVCNNILAALAGQVDLATALDRAQQQAEEAVR